MPAKKKTAKRASVRKRSAAKTSVRRKSLQPDGLRLSAVAPSLTVNDLEASLSWYRDTLGFVVKERWEHEGKLAGVEVAAGRVSLYLGQDDWKKGRDRVKGVGARLHCTTGQDVDRLAEAIRAHGGRLLEEPHDEPWGGRAFALADPDGFKLTISST